MGIIRRPFGRQSRQKADLADQDQGARGGGVEGQPPISGRIGQVRWAGRAQALGAQKGLTFPFRLA